MSKPSWLEPTNNLEQISRPPFSPLLQHQTPSFDVHKVRCLWLISFIQDMRTFMGSFHASELPSSPIAHAAVGLLRQDFQLSLESPPSTSHVTQRENELLVCLFLISVLVQESMSTLAEGDYSPPTIPNGFDGFEKFLTDSHHIWGQSVYKLRSVLYESLTLFFEGGQHKMDYAMNLVQILGTLSLEARQGVEKCLLNLLYHLGDNDKRTMLVNDGWSPDSLLSSIHGH